MGFSGPTAQAGQPHLRSQVGFLPEQPYFNVYLNIAEATGLLRKPFRYGAAGSCGCSRKAPCPGRPGGFC